MAYLPQQVGQDPITKALGYLSRQIDQLKKYTFNTTISGSITGGATSANQTNGSQKTQVVSAGGTNIDFATSTKQSDGSQKTQIVDSLGNVLLTSGTPAKLMVEITRPADTPGAYSAGDAVNTSTSVPTIITFADAAIANGGGGFLYLLKAESNMTALAGQTLRYWFYNDTPSGMVGDHVAFVNSYANASKRCFYIDLTFDPLLAGSDTVFGQVKLSDEYITKAAGKYLYGLIQTLTSWTPTSGGKITTSLSVVKLS